MSLAGESCLDTPHCKILHRRPMIRTRRNPSRRNLLLNIMPVSTDPGLSPSTSHLTSPVSHRSSWSSASESEQPPSCKSARQGGKINQLIKVNEAIAVEIADLKSGKDRSLEKLKLLEARICSNLVNINKWAAENKSKLVSIEDGGYVGDLKVGENLSSGASSPWRLSLADLVTIFKGSKLEHGNRLPLEHLKDSVFFPFTDENLSYSGHEGSSPSSNKGNFTCNGANDYPTGCSTLKGLASSQGDIPVSSSKQAKFPVDISMKKGENTHHLPEHPSEAYEVVSGEGRHFSSVGINSVVAGANGSLKEEDSIPIDANHAVESTSRLSSTLFTKAISPSEISPSRGAAYPPHKRERQHSRGRLALNEKNFPTNPEQGPAARLGVEAVEKEIGDSGDDAELSERDECTQFSKGVSHMLGNEEQSHTASSRARLHDALSVAREEVKQLKQHALTLEKEKSELQSTLIDCKQALQDAKLEAATLHMQKEQVQTMFTDLKASSESAQLALLKEKDDQGNKLLCCVKSLEEAQQSAIVLERQKLVLLSELNYCREVLEKTQKEFKTSKKEKAALDLELTGCKQMLKEAQQSAVLFEKEREDFAVRSREYKTNLEKNQQHSLMLEKDKDELRRDLAESKHTLEEVLQKSCMLEREKSDLEADHESLMSDLEKSEQNVLVLENENAVIENALTQFKHTLEEIQQQVIVLEGEKDDLESELNESKQACKEAWQHALSLEEEKGALEIQSCEYKELLEETEQHVLALQSALEATLQRADALDRQVQRLRSETKRLSENNESLKALKNEQETKCRELERQRECLEAEMESIKSKKEAAEESVVKINTLHALAMEEIKKEREQEQSIIKKESDSLKLLLEGATQRTTNLEADQKEMQERLKDGECSLQKAMQELDALKAEHGNEMAALKIQNVANEGKIQTLMEQLQVKCIELERLCKVEDEVSQLGKKLEDRELQLENTAGELESMKAEMNDKLINLQKERSAKEGLTQELDAKDNKVKQLEKDLIMIRAEQTGLRGAMKGEMVKKKELMQKLLDEQGRSEELKIALESAKLEQNNLLMELENEKMAKEAALEEMQAIKSDSDELEKDFHKLQAEVSITLEKENEEQADALQALHEEQTRNRELEEAMDLRNAEHENVHVAWEDERDANEALMQELEQEQQQRMQLEKQLKVLRDEEKHVGALLQEERGAMERLKKQLDSQEARCRELENALNCAKIEQDNMQMVLEEEAMSKRAVMQELEEQQSRCLVLEQMEAMKDENGVNPHTKGESLSLQVTELLARSKKLEQLLSTMQREGADDRACSAVTQEVKKLQSCIQNIELKLADAAYVKGEEDKLRALLEESSTFEPGAASLEAHGDKPCDSSMDVARQTEEEVRRLKESTEIHQAMFDAHHTAISDVAGLLVELKSLKRLLERKGSVSLPTAALSTSALAAVGLLAFLKFPKYNIT